MCGCKTLKYNDEANLLLELFLQMCCQSAIVVKKIKVVFPLYKDKKHIKIFIKKILAYSGNKFCCWNFHSFPTGNSAHHFAAWCDCH